MDAPLIFTFGERGTATVVESDGNVVLLDATFSSAPGRPLEGSAEGVTYKIKVRSSKKQPGDATRFLIEGRFYDLTKAQRDRVTIRKA